MITLDDRPSTVQAKTPDWLSPEQIRRSALSCLVTETTTENLRVRTVRTCADLKLVWLAWAAEIEALAPCGLTGQFTREGAKIALALGNYSADDLRQSAPDRHVAARLARVADLMDALLADGFDPAEFAKALHLEDGPDD